MYGNNVIKSLFTSLAQQKAGENVATDLAGKYNLSSESLDDASRSRATADLNSVSNAVDIAITAVRSPMGKDENAEFTAAQINAAQLISKLAVCSKEDLFKSITSTHRGDASAPYIQAGSLGEELFDGLSLAQEAYDGMKVSNALYFSVAYNILAARQDEFGEAFFPTITIDPMQSGIVIENIFASVQNEVIRDAHSATNKFNKIPLIKLLTDSKALTKEKNKVIPVFDTNVQQYFLSSFQSNNTETGEAIVTAPLAVNEEIDLIGISQTRAMLEKGVMDNTDSLDRTIQLRRVYFKLDSETFYFDAAAYPYSNFEANPQGSVKETFLKFKNDNIAIKTSIKQANGTASTILAPFADMTLVFKIDIDGSANTETGTTMVKAGIFKLAKVINASGDELPATDATYTAIVTAIKTPAIVGYTLDAWRTNSNLRTRGMQLTIDRYNQEYQVPIRTGFQALVPTVLETGRENDVDYLNSVIQATHTLTSINAAVTLNNYASFLEASIGNGVAKNLEVNGVGRFSVNPYFKHEHLELKNYLDSVKDSERLEDIRAAILNKIKDEVLQMDISSNYGVAHRIANNDTATVKTVIIGTDNRIKDYLCGDGDNKIKLSNNIEAVIVGSYLDVMKGKIFVSFGVFDNDRNVKPNPLNFGQMAWAPVITTDVVRTVNNSTSREILTMPRFLHIVNLPCLIQIDVSDIDVVLGKVTINSHAI